MTPREIRPLDAMALGAVGAVGLAMGRTWAPEAAGFWVLAAWAGLEWSGRWAPEPGWPDSPGRILGVFWIAVALLSYLGPDLYLLRCGCHRTLSG